MDKFGVGALIAMFGLFCASVAGWITHIVYCFQQHEYVLLLVGALVAPVGTIHGWGIWFGWW